jgi:hypothetical protein
LSNDNTSTAIHVWFGKTFCQSQAGQDDSLVVARNWIIGPGTGDQGARSGLTLYSLCGSLEREVLVEENYVEGFKTAGLDFNETSDAQVTCNTVFDCLRAVDVHVGNDPGPQGIRFKKNWLEVTAGEEELIRTNDAPRAKFGPSTSDKGDNGFMVVDEDVDFIRETDPSDSLLKATYCYWYLYDLDTGQSEFLDTPFENNAIVNRLAPYGDADVNFIPKRTNDQNPLYCKATSPPTPGASHRSPKAARLEETGPRPEEGPSSGPTEAFLEGRARGSSVDLLVGVPPTKEGRYVLELFDVTGRRVVTLLDDQLVRGIYTFPWDGRDFSGVAVASGVYFAKVRGPDVARTTKVVLVR